MTGRKASMTDRAEKAVESRVLLMAPTARDAQITSDLFARAGLNCVCCRNPSELTQLIEVGAGAVLLTDEALTDEGVGLLLTSLDRQAAWSDLPVVLMLRGLSHAPPVDRLVQALSNVTVLERPAPTNSVISAVQAAVRGRLRQYQTREQIETIREAEERLAFSLEAGNLGSWELDLATTTMVCSGRCKENFGRDPLLEFSYQDLFKAIHPEDRQRVAQAVQMALTDHKDYVAEYRVNCPDASERWVYVRGRALYSSNGIAFRMAGISLDITEQKRAEQQRQEVLDAERAARAEAERVGRMKDEFLATLSHELRTPLNAILGWSHLLQMPQVDPEDLTEGLTTIERNARTQTQLIDDLLDMSRIISGKIRMQFKLMDIAAVVEAAIATVQHSADAKGVKIETNIQPDAGMTSGDPVRLQQVVWNLLSNAIKFTDRGDAVRVRLRRTRSQMEIEVADSGRGIDVDFLPHVFERFRQADARTTREHGGLGLGLAIVKHLVELHGGSASVTSQGKGTGSVFTIQLPISAVRHEDDIDSKPQSQPVNAATAPKPVKLAGLKVLVVDDETDARELLRRVLNGSEAKVMLASSAAEALAVVDAEHPDVIVSDIGMPMVDGYELMRKVRAMGNSRGRIPAIALTAFARVEDRAKALEAGYSAHLTKPVEASELLAAVATLTERGGV
jgi:PAS domain S-box-containing protein